MIEIETRANEEYWKRYKIKTDSLIAQNHRGFKGLYLYNVGADILQVLAQVLNLEIYQNPLTRWIGFEDPKTGIEVMIFQ